jgi:5-methylcytosine-specific restriction endonuclease McrA
MRVSSKKSEVDKIFKPNEDGISEWISVDQLKGTKIELTNNGNQRYGVFFGDSRYKWEKKGTHKTEALRTIGFGHGKSQDRPISSEIRKKMKNRFCSNCGGRNNLVVDHKNDFYNDKRVLNVKTQTEEDFQPLCEHCNLLKRSINEKERKTKKLWSAKQLPRYRNCTFEFVWEKKVYDEEDIDCKKGTYWYDIQEFDNNVQFYQMYRIPINQAIKKYWMKREFDEMTALFGKMCVCN